MILRKSFNATAFRQQHFNRATCQVQRNGVLMENVLGYRLSDESLISIAGAPSGSVVELTDKPRWTTEEIPDGEDVPSGLLLTVHNDRYFEEPVEVVLFLDGHMSITSIYVKLVVLRPSGLKGLAGHMVCSMAEGSGSLPLAGRIRLLAAGGRLWPDRKPGLRWAGHLAWPKYGFDAPLPAPTLALAPHFPYYPAGLATCSMVSEMLGKVGGKEFWHTAGDGGYMNFSLIPGSDSFAQLERFLLT